MSYNVTVAKVGFLKGFPTTSKVILGLAGVYAVGAATWGVAVYWHHAPSVTASGRSYETCHLKAITFDFFNQDLQGKHQVAKSDKWFWTDSYDHGEQVALGPMEVSSSEHYTPMSIGEAAAGTTPSPLGKGSTKELMQRLHWDEWDITKRVGRDVVTVEEAYWPDIRRLKLTFRIGGTTYSVLGTWSSRRPRVWTAEEAETTIEPHTLTAISDYGRDAIWIDGKDSESKRPATFTEEELRAQDLDFEAVCRSIRS